MARIYSSRYSIILRSIWSWNKFRRVFILINLFHSLYWPAFYQVVPSSGQQSENYSQLGQTHWKRLLLKFSPKRLIRFGFQNRKGPHHHLRPITTQEATLQGRHHLADHWMTTKSLLQEEELMRLTLYFVHDWPSVIIESHKWYKMVPRKHVNSF